MLTSVAFVAFTWHPIWEDFEKQHQAVATGFVEWLGSISQDHFVQKLVLQSRELANFAAESAVRITLAVLAVVLLGWGWRPFWNLRRHLHFIVRSALGEQTWIDQEDAIKLIRASDWAKLREPTYNIFDQLTGDRIHRYTV